MGLWLKRIGYTLVGLIGLLVVAVVVLVVLLERGYLDGPISRQASRALGREVTLTGPIPIDFGWRTSVSLGPLTIGNPDYVTGDPMLRLAKAEAAVDVWELLHGRVVIPRVIVGEPDARLVRLADGRANWDFGSQPKTEKQPEEAGGPVKLPRIDLAELHGGKIRFEDGTTGRNLEGTLEARATPEAARTKLVADLGVTDLAAKGDPGPPQTAHLEGFVDNPAAPQDGFDLALTSRGDRTDRLLALAGVPVKGALPGFGIDLKAARDAKGWKLPGVDLRLGDARVQGKGSLRDIAKLDGLDLDLDADIPEVGRLMEAFGLGRRAVPALKFKAQGRRDGGRNALDLNGTFGEDTLKASASTEGPIADLRGLEAKVDVKGTRLGRLLPLFGMTEKPVPAYRLAATVGREGEQGARVDLDGALGGTSFGAKGLIADVRAGQGVDLDVRVAGQDPSDILDLFGLPKISLPPYKVAGRVGREGGTIRVRGLDGRVGNSDVAGDASVDIGKKPVAVVADLSSNRLEFDDLAGLIGLPPSTAPGQAASPAQKEAARRQEASSRLLPDVKIDAKAWRNLNLDVRYKGKSVNAPKLPFRDLAFHVVTKDGWLTLDPFQAAIADGQFVANASLDGSSASGPPAADLDLKVRNLQLNEFLSRFGFQNDALGRFGGRAQLKAKGASLRDLAATADGRVALTMEGGVINRVIPEAAGIDLGQGITDFLKDKLGPKEDNRQQIRCVIADFGVKQGVMDAQTVLVDLPEDKLTLQGQINLRDETMDLMFHAYPRDASVGSSRMPIHIDGPIKSPSAAPAPGYVRNKTLGWVLAPLAALVPFVELGSGDDHPCAGVIDRVKEAAQPG